MKKEMYNNLTDTLYDLYLQETNKNKKAKLFITLSNIISIYGENNYYGTIKLKPLVELED